MWLAKSDPTDCAGVDWSYTNGPPPVYFGSSAYSKNACVVSPFGVTEPENPAPVMVTVGAPVRTDGIDDCGADGEFGAGVLGIGGLDDGCTTAVRFEVAGLDCPPSLVAVTSTWTVWPTSLWPSV